MSHQAVLTFCSPSFGTHVQLRLIFQLRLRPINCGITLGRPGLILETALRLMNSSMRPSIFVCWTESVPSSLGLEHRIHMMMYCFLHQQYTRLKACPARCIHMSILTATKVCGACLQSCRALDPLTPKPRLHSVPSRLLTKPSSRPPAARLLLLSPVTVPLARQQRSYLGRRFRSLRR